MLKSSAFSSGPSGVDDHRLPTPERSFEHDVRSVPSVSQGRSVERQRIVNRTSGEQIARGYNCRPRAGGKRLKNPVQNLTAGGGPKHFAAFGPKQATERRGVCGDWCCVSI